MKLQLLKQKLGSLLWICQTRYDLSFSITKIATDATASIGDNEKMMILLKYINKTRAKELRGSVTEQNFELKSQRSPAPVKRCVDLILKSLQDKTVELKIYL